MEYAHLGPRGRGRRRWAWGLGLGPELRSPMRTRSWTGPEHGINYIDTQRLGHQNMATTGPRKSSALVLPRAAAPRADRLSRRSLRGPSAWPIRREAISLHIRQACDASLARRQTDPSTVQRAPHRPETAVGGELGGDVASCGTQGKISSRLSNSRAGTSPREQSPPRSGTSSDW